jgi:hypothetical protein
MHICATLADPTPLTLVRFDVGLGSYQALVSEDCAVYLPSRMDSPERRRSPRYPVQRPVAVTLAPSRVSTSARSENMSLNGILFASDVLILEGYVVELVIEIGSSLVLTGRGQVLRVDPRPSANFAMAVACDVPFRIARQGRQ